MKKVLLIVIIFVCSIGYSQKIEVGKIYKQDRNVYREDPFLKKDVETIKIIAIKNGYAKYVIIKGWCCIGSSFSRRIDIIQDMVNSYNSKYKN